MKNTDPSIRDYLAEIGRRGGLRSRRRLSSECARDMVRVREARRAFRLYHAQCFWHLRKDLTITKDDVPAVVDGLRKHGGRKGFLLASRLCR